MEDNRNIKYYIDEDYKNANVSLYYKNTYVYGWGKNKYGELGIAHTNNLNIPTAIKSLQNQIISQVCSGGKHTVILTKEGTILVAGTDVLGLLGSDNKKWKEQHKFQKLSSLDTEFVIQVACAEFHSLCLTEDGYVYGWGGNLSNVSLFYIIQKKLGQINIAGVPTRINALIKKKIILISCGDHHSTALSSANEIFSWGGGGASYNKGQCGHGDLKDVDAPKRIEFFRNKKPTKVVCGGYHTIVLCEDQLLYGFGKGEYGQCGYGISEDSSNPKLIKFGRKTAFFEQENIHKLDITNINNVILNLDESNVYKSPLQILDIKCGGEHTVILSSMGRLYTFGHGWTGQLGLGNNRNYDRPMIVKSLLNKKVVQITAGWSHTLVLTDNGNLYGAGCGKYGELGLRDNENKRNFTLIKPASMLNIKHINSGGHHSWIIIDEDSPEREEDYENPSPLATPNFTPNNARSVENSPRLNKQNASMTANNISKQATKIQNPIRSNINNNIKFNLDLLTEKIEKVSLKNSLQVVYTDLKKCHRFIRFFINKNKNLIHKDLNNMLADYFKNDKAVVLHRLQADNDINLKEDGDKMTRMNVIFREIKNDFKMLDLNSSIKQSYSLTIIYDHEANSNMSLLKKNIDDLRLKNNISSNSKNRSIYEVVNITEDDIKSSQVEQIMSSWIIDFFNRFSSILENDMDHPRYMELRPNCFYI